MKRTTRMCMAIAMALSLLTGCGGSPATEQDVKTEGENARSNQQEDSKTSDNQETEDATKAAGNGEIVELNYYTCLLYTSPSPRD